MIWITASTWTDTRVNCKIRASAVTLSPRRSTWTNILRSNIIKRGRVRSIARMTTMEILLRGNIYNARAMMPSSEWWIILDLICKMANNRTLIMAQPKILMTILITMLCWLKTNLICRGPSWRTCPRKMSRCTGRIIGNQTDLQSSKCSARAAAPLSGSAKIKKMENWSPLNSFRNANRTKQIYGAECKNCNWTESFSIQMERHISWCKGILDSCRCAVCLQLLRRTKIFGWYSSFADSH